MANIELGTHLRGASERYHDCVEACGVPGRMRRRANACLDEANVKMMVECIWLDRDCAEARRPRCVS